VYRRWLWPGFALPGIVWLIVLFLVPFYAVVAVAFGTVDPILLQPVPVWNPLEWNVGWIVEVLERLAPGGSFFGVAVRTIVYVAIALTLSLLIGYPVAYYIARHAGRTKSILLILLIAPLWINYLMRMLAWVNLLAPDGYVNRFLTFTHVLAEPRDWLGGRASTVILALVYGYIPFMILPLFAALDRIDRSHLEAARDLGASRLSTFLHVTLPLSKVGILGAPETSMIGNQIDYYFHFGGQPTIGAAITVVLAVFLTVLMAYYLWTIHKAAREARTA
jgi:spermidine/putrescine transport system permease protein